MTSQDFNRLAEIYGADIKRWPEEYRHMIGGLAESNFSGMRQILDTEMALDAVLNTHWVDAPKQALIDNILASAPKPRQNILQRWANDLSGKWDLIISTPGLALTYIGFTGVGLAGAVAGAFFVSILSTQTSLNDTNDDSQLNAAELMNFSQDWR